MNGNYHGPQDTVDNANLTTSISISESANVLVLGDKNDDDLPEMNGRFDQCQLHLVLNLFNYCRKQHYRVQLDGLAVASSHRTCPTASNHFNSVESVQTIEIRQEQ